MMEKIDWKLKDVINYVIYLIPFVVFIATMDKKIDKLAENQINLQLKIDEMKIEKKEVSLEQKQFNYMIQAEVKSLAVTAEVNKTNIGINKIDIGLLNAKVDKLLDKK